MAEYSHGCNMTPGYTPRLALYQLQTSSFMISEEHDDVLTIIAAGSVFTDVLCALRATLGNNGITW